jgi:hypothetical protein
MIFRHDRTGGGGGRLLELTVKWWVVENEREKGIKRIEKINAMIMVIDKQLGGVLVFSLLFLFC